MTTKSGIFLHGAPEPMYRWHLSSGLELAGDTWGDADRQAVVLLHGAGQTRHAWKATGDRLAHAGFYAIAYDARGHGDSHWAPDSDYSRDANVADLLGIIERAGVERPVLVGASMGGVTSLLATGEGHVEAAALVMVDIAPRMEIEGVNNVRSFMASRPEGYESLEEVAESIARYLPHRSAPKSMEGLAKNLRLGNDGRYHWHWDPRTRDQDQEDQEPRRQRLERCAESLTIPTLLIRGGLSDILSEEGAQGFLQLCPAAQYVNVSGVGHMVAGDRNDAFTAAVLQFLTTQLPSSS